MLTNLLYEEIADEYRSVSEQIKSMRSVIDDDSWNRDISRVIPKLVNYERNKDEILSYAIVALKHYGLEIYQLQKLA